jgi:predicted nucleotidyltransferase component of viral defense system
MDARLKVLQSRVLRVFAAIDKHSFALAGGTALERYYFKHRFSRDLDFFTKRFDLTEIERITGIISRELNCQISKDAEFFTDLHAQVIFYMLKCEDMERPLKIDFVEDVVSSSPRIITFKDLPVYAAEEIYYQKIFTIAGTHEATDITGRSIFTGRNKARDAVDLYYLSRKIKPLHLYLKEFPRAQQRMFVRWARTYSRMDMKLAVLDLDIYDRKFDVRKMIKYIDDEIDQFIGEIIWKM